MNLPTNTLHGHRYASAQGSAEYLCQPRVFQAAGKTPAEVKSLMQTINFNKAVGEVTFKAGDRIYRYELLNAPARGEMHFFTDAEGASGIMRVSQKVLSNMRAGQTLDVYELKFGLGRNSFMAGKPGEIFITHLPRCSVKKWHYFRSRRIQI